MAITGEISFRNPNFDYLQRNFYWVNNEDELKMLKFKGH